ncbi:MAG: clan AA aspartic protease [Candidatus Poribacteria bacterium]|nr:clan AA aspartic protease [Candidatus Poribacteria bacterium]
MIKGKITAYQEAVIELEVIGLNQPTRIEAVIDTGFTGYLTLPSTLINHLKLQQAGEQITILGDENRVVLKRHIAKVLWHGAERNVYVLQAEGGPLIGMSLLYGSRLMLEVVTDGDVTVDALPN